MIDDAEHPFRVIDAAQAHEKIELQFLVIMKERRRLETIRRGDLQPRIGDALEFCIDDGV